jgi:hypothetical protein
MSVTKRADRQIRRALGPELSDLVAAINVRSRISASILRRGFWGRMKWLCFGR